MGSLLGGKAPKQTSSNEVTVPSWLDSQNRTLVDRAATASNKGYTPYTGNRIADFNSDNMAAFQGIRDQQGKYSGLINQASQGVNDLFGRVNGPTAEQIASGMNPYLRNVLDISKRNSIEDFQRSDATQRRREGLIGAFGGSRVALGQAQRNRNFERDLADREQQGLFEGYNQSLNQFNQGTQNLMSGIQSGMATAQGGQQLDMDNIMNLLKSGEVQRGQNQQEADFNYEQFDREQAYPYEQVNFLANILNPLTGAYRGGSTTQTSKSGSGSKLGQIAGTAASVAGLFGFSDERVKENIKEVGKLKNGLSVYSYNYKGMPETMIGLLAQDVEKQNPDAVGEREGIKTVDYDKATKKFASGGAVDADSRERAAKMYTPYQFSPFQFTSPSGGGSEGDSGMGGLAGLGSLFGGNGNKSILSLFDGGGGGATVADFAGLGMLANGGEVQEYADGGVVGQDIFTKGIMNARKMYDDAEQRKQQVTDFYTPETEDIPFLESAARGVAAQFGQIPPLVTQGVAKVSELSNRGMANLFSKPSALREVTNAEAATTPSTDEDVINTARVQALIGQKAKPVALPEIGGAPNMPPRNPNDMAAYIEEMRNKNAAAVYGGAPDLPVREVGTVRDAVPVQTEMPMDMPAQTQMPAESEDDGLQLFGRKVNMPLLMAGLAMLGSEGNFGEQVAAGAKAGIGTYQAAKDKKTADKAAQQEAGRQAQKDQLEYLKTMAYIDQVKKQGNMTPYQQAMLEIARHKAETARMKTTATEDNPLAEIENPLDDVAIELLKNSDLLTPNAPN